MKTVTAGLSRGLENVAVGLLFTLTLKENCSRGNQPMSEAHEGLTLLSQGY